MTSAGEVFVLQLARASRKANRFVRHLQRADREDILAAALMWCWKNRESYSLTATLEQWFVGAVRNAYRDWQNGEATEAAESIAEIPTGDTTAANAEVESSAQALIRALPSEYKKVALMLARGLTRDEMMARGISRDTYDATRVRIKQLRRLLPEPHEFRAAIVRVKPPDSDSTTPVSNIDREIEELEAMPKHGKDCPPCWRCKWFEGYMPGAHVPMRMPIIEPEVSAAVSATEGEKVRIAQEVRDGNL